MLLKKIQTLNLLIVYLFVIFIGLIYYLLIWLIKQIVIIHNLLNIYTVGFIKTVPSVYTFLMNTIYLYFSTHITEGTVFRKQNRKNIAH